MVPKTEGGVRGVTGRAGFLPVLLQATSDHSDLPDIQTQRPVQFKQCMPGAGDTQMCTLNTLILIENYSQ